MRIVLSIVGLILIVLAGVAAWQFFSTPNPDRDAQLVLDQSAVATTSPVSIIAEGLEIPWEVIFLPSGEILVTERTGNVLLLTAKKEIPIDGVRHIGEGGLLGAALHPNFTENGYLYLYQTTERDGGLINRIVRYQLNDTELTFDRIIFDDLPGARYHDGGRIQFGPDGYLYATVGDATSAQNAADPETLYGTIIRITDTGDIPDENPFGSAVYSYGHRNPQGLAWDDAGHLWSSEHGRSVGGSGFDELNLIRPGEHYGWPDSEGDEVASGTVAPVRHSTAAVTWAPGDIAFHQGSLYIPGLRGQTLYEAVIEGTTVVAWHEHLIDTYGRLRSVTVGPDGFLYITTSNTDGRGDTPHERDDRIVRVDPTQLTRE